MKQNPPKHEYPLVHHNLNAPRQIVPYLVSRFNPKSVADVGCGVGTFLHVFLENGVKDILGIDGDWVNKSALFFPEVFFVEKDLEKKIQFDKKFDLVLCLEVAEHLSEDSADILISNLTSLGNIIVFSAATVHQGGQNHLNEQHVAYWVEKFKKKGFVFHDVFRWRFWNNADVNWWYKQNMFLVAHHLIDISIYKLDADNSKEIFEYIHPDLLALRANEARSFEDKLNWIKRGKAPVSYYLQLLGNKLALKFRPFKRNF